MIIVERPMFSKFWRAETSDWPLVPLTFPTRTIIMESLLSSVFLLCSCGLFNYFYYSFICHDPIVSWTLHMKCGLHCANFSECMLSLCCSSCIDSIMPRHHSCCSTVICLLFVAVFCVVTTLPKFFRLWSFLFLTKYAKWFSGTVYLEQPVQTICALSINKPILLLVLTRIFME